MASVNAQSVEDFADRIIYRYPAGRYEQAPVTYRNICSPGLKTLVNTSSSLSYIIPSSGISARFFKIEWIINVGAVLYNTATPSAFQTIKIDFLRYYAASLNYDGKPLQTEFYDKKTENYYQAQQLRAINIVDISIEPVGETTNLSGAGFGLNDVLDWDISNAVHYLVALLQPVVTYYKK